MFLQNQLMYECVYCLEWINVIIIKSNFRDQMSMAIMAPELNKCEIYIGYPLPPSEPFETILKEFGKVGSIKKSNDHLIEQTEQIPSVVSSYNFKTLHIN